MPFASTGNMTNSRIILDIIREPGGVLVYICHRGMRCREGQGHPNQDTNIEVKNEIFHSIWQ